MYNKPTRHTRTQLIMLFTYTHTTFECSFLFSGKKGVAQPNYAMVQDDEIGFVMRMD